MMSCAISRFASGRWAFRSSFGFLLANYPELMGHALRLIQWVLSTYVVRKTGFTRAFRCTTGYLQMLTTRQTGTVLLLHIPPVGVGGASGTYSEWFVSFGRLQPENVTDILS